MARPSDGGHVAGQDPHRGGLACAVRAEEPEDFSPFDAKTDIVHGRDAAVAFRDVLDLDHAITPFRPPVRSAGCFAAREPCRPDAHGVRYREKADYSPIPDTTDTAKNVSRRPVHGVVLAA